MCIVLAENCKGETAEERLESAKTKAKHFALDGCGSIDEKKVLQGNKAIQRVFPMQKDGVTIGYKVK